MIKIIYITENGSKLAHKIKNILKYYLYDCCICNLKEFTIEGREKGFIFIMATGIVIRKYIDKIKRDKREDPFVITIDEFGKCIVPMLSNHLGGGNYFSKLIGMELGSNVVFTTATDVNNKVGIDEISRIYFLEKPNREDILKINRKILREKVNLHLPKNWKIINNNLSNTYDINYHKEDYVVVDDEIVLNPKKIVIGIGCRRDIEPYRVYWTVKKALYLRDMPPWRIDGLATVDIKKHEKGILMVGKKLNKRVYIINREEIINLYAQRKDLNKSYFVFKSIGVYGVSEPCSILGVNKLSNNYYEGKYDKIELILKKLKNKGVTVSIAIG
ncbi:cobalamin biosynthesis protein [Methanothermococcus sp. SCGC AD-155-M21]|nr:cobalamin biosynthesis protein [Methanothermococcus sp. SCGC AD-155-M21]